MTDGGNHTNLDLPRLRETWQFVNDLPMDFSPAGASQPQDGEKQRPFVFLSCNLDGGCSSLYASSRSHLIVKLARGKAELEPLLRDENDA